MQYATVDDANGVLCIPILQSEKYVYYDEPNNRWALKVIEYYDSGEWVEILWIQDFNTVSTELKYGSLRLV